MSILDIALFAFSVPVLFAVFLIPVIALTKQVEQIAKVKTKREFLYAIVGLVVLLVLFLPIIG